MTRPIALCQLGFNECAMGNYAAAAALAGMGTSLLPSNPAGAAVHLREALAFYRRIGSPEAQRIQDTLAEHGL